MNETTNENKKNIVIYVVVVVILLIMFVVWLLWRRNRSKQREKTLREYAKGATGDYEQMIK